MASGTERINLLRVQEGTVEEATHESVATTLEEREATQGQTNMTTWKGSLAALMAQAAELVCQLARDNKVQLEERPEDEKALAVAQERGVAQQR